jgi:hypothetical protein
MDIKCYFVVTLHVYVFVNHHNQTAFVCCGVRGVKRVD